MNKLMIPTGLVIALGAGIVLAPQYAGLLLMFSLFLFGAMALVWRDNNMRLACLVALVLLAVVNIAANGMKFGIDFVGGTRIPVILEKSVDTATMEQLVSIIKTRASVLGLTEVKVKAVGDTEINVEIPSSDEKQVAFIESVLSHQGVYLGVVDGKVALKGDDIYSHSIHRLNQQQLGGSDWGVGFSITQNAAEYFAEVVKGKAHYPVYMFLDREENAVVFLTKEQAKKNAPEDAPESEIYAAMNNAMKLGGSTLSFHILDGNASIPSPTKKINTINESEDDYSFDTNATTTTKTYAIISKTLDKETKDKLVSLGYTLKEKEPDELTPEIRDAETGFIVSKWKAIGLLDAPTLSPDITTGKVSRDYSIGGGVSLKSGQDKQTAIDENSKSIESILKGGSLPVGISLGSSTRIPASLGSEFLKLSLIGIGAALLAVAIFVGLRYRHIRVIAAILAVSVSEFIVLASILGSFTIDLAGVAGIIAAIGVGVDAQIVITDELLKKHLALADRLGHAFEIIKMNVVVAVVAMVPLLFSGLVEIISFAIASILGLLLGFLLSRPAYGVLAETILEQDDKK